MAQEVPNSSTAPMDEDVPYDLDTPVGWAFWLGRPSDDDYDDPHYDEYDE